MNLCHIYNQTTNSPHVKKILAAFDESVSYEISQLNQVGEYKIYLIETNSVDKVLSAKLKSYFDSKTRPLIYFIIPKEYNLMFFQLAFLLSAKNIITPAQDTDKAIVKIKYDFKTHEEGNSEKELNFLSTKISFMESLKDKIIERSISKKSYSIITISIENIKKLEMDLNRADMTVLLKDFLFEVEAVLDKKLILAQYSGDFYVALFENINFLEMQRKAKNLQTQLTHYINKQKYYLALGIYVFDTGDTELNDILIILDNIANKTLSKEQISKHNLQYICSEIHENMSDDEKIALLFDSAFINETEIKLLNIYKGLCINTSSKIIKKNADNIYIQFEQLQGIVMKNEKETILQSSSFIKDIRAQVKYIDLHKKIAILEKFEFLNSNANARKYSRVTCLGRTPLLVSYPGGTINGEILDISVKSIAIKTKYFKNVDSIKSKKVMLNVTLPTQINVDGFAKLSLEAEVTFTARVDEDDYKIVCDLSEDASNESILMEYVYNRQKEIIIEIKKMVKSV